MSIETKEARFIEAPDGVRTTFTIADSYQPGSMAINYGGSSQRVDGSAFIEVPPSTVVFGVAPFAATFLEAEYLEAV